MNIRTIIIDGHRYRVAVADTWRTRARGLAHTTLHDWRGIDGMLFTFPFAARWPIWMRGMQFPIRAVWLRGGTVVDVHPRLTPDRPWALWRPRQSADQLVELFVDHHSLLGLVGGKSKKSILVP